MTTLFIAFLVLELLALVVCAVYVRLPTPGARSTQAAPIVVAPQLPRAVAIPTAWRRDRWPRC